MQLSKISTAASDASLFGYTVYAPLNNVLALGPAILIDTTVSYRTGVSAYLLNEGLSASPQISKLCDVAADTLWVSARSNKPLQVTEGVAGGQMLRFGFGGNLSPSTGNGFLAQEQSAQYNMSGSYTVGFVARRPAASEIGGANPGAGAVIGANNPAYGYTGVFMNYYVGAGIYHNGSNIGGWLSGETVGTSIAYLFSFNSSAGTLDIWQNGTHVYQDTGISTLWGAGNNLLIGASIGTVNFFSQLDIAGVCLFPGVAFANGSSGAATINAWLNTYCRANVT